MNHGARSDGATDQRHRSALARHDEGQRPTANLARHDHDLPPAGLFLDEPAIDTCRSPTLTQVTQKALAFLQKAVRKNGGPGGTRTHIPRSTNPALFAC